MKATRMNNGLFGTSAGAVLYRARWWALSLLLSLLAACGGGSSGGGDGTTTPTQPTVTPPTSDAKYTLTVSSQPLSVSVATDDPRAVTQTVAAASGGSLSATGADGTVYTLTVPANALPADTAITMTPIASFNSLPFNGSDTSAAWGVQLAPEGMTFHAELTLHIAPPSGTTLPINQQLPFSWKGTGQAVSLAALDPASAAVDLKLLHFSGWAIARHSLGVSASLSGLRDRLGGDVEARMESALAERLAAERERAQQGQADPGLMSSEEFAAYLALYDVQVIKPRVAAAGRSCANGRLAMETLLKVSGSLQRLGISDPYQAQALALFPPTATLCIDEEYKKCHDNHIVQDIGIAAIGMERQAELLGLSQGEEWTAWQVHASDVFEQCHRYTLDFNSTAGSSKPNPGWDFTEQMIASLKLRLSGPLFVGNTVNTEAKIVGYDTLTSLSYSMTYIDNCLKVSGITQAPTFLAVQNLQIYPAKDGSLADFRLLYLPGRNPSTHNRLNTCDSPPTTSVEPFFAWATVYYIDVLGNPLYYSNTDGPFIDQWTINQGSRVIATKDIAPTLAQGTETFTAPTHFKLTHTPGE